MKFTAGLLGVAETIYSKFEIDKFKKIKAHCGSRLVRHSTCNPCRSLRNPAAVALGHRPSGADCASWPSSA